MSDGAVIRLFEFRPVRGAFDSILRDVMIPDLRLLPGLQQVYVGRQGPDEIGDRVVASIWTSRRAMAAAVGETFEVPRFHAEYLEETTDRRLDCLPLAFAIEGERVEPVALIRLVAGRVRPGELDDYVREALQGTQTDAAAGTGPNALYLATRPPDRFRTLSVWPDWTTLQEATGGNPERPIATRHAERLIDWGVSHYEALPDLGADVVTGVAEVRR